MPEQITKYPDVTFEMLKGGGAVCGKGAPQKTLTQCPGERFCSALDARAAGFDVAVIEDACRAIDLEGSLARAWKDMHAVGVKRSLSTKLPE